MSTYILDELMAQTRRLAVDYREKTGQVLAVANELARYDLARLFSFSTPNPPQASIDFIGEGDWSGCLIQLKSRVLFEKQGPKRAKQRLGHLNFEAKWDTVFLLLFDAQYEPFEIYALDRKSLEAEIDPSRYAAKGPISVAKFKSLATLVWPK
jgi:hypothetical protein